MTQTNSAIVIGAGLAGCEAAWSCAQRGVPVTLYEQKPLVKSPAHHSENFAELVCSNSLKSKLENKAPGMLKAWCREKGSLLLECADVTSVPAGNALAVDRDQFSALVTGRINSHPLIMVKHETVLDIKTLPQGRPIALATGPLTDDKLLHSLELDQSSLFFYDASSPIIRFDSIDMQKAFFGERYGDLENSSTDYINCPFTVEQYDAFHVELVNARRAKLHDFDFPVFEGCMPVERLAGRGKDALRYGMLKPVGFSKALGWKPHAVLQLRREDREGVLWNMVGFQTNLVFPEQKRVFRMIPGLERAEFVRYGLMHRNTYVDAPRVLDKYLRLKNKSGTYVFAAGQLNGMEGYNAAIASGIYCGINLARVCKSEPLYMPNEGIFKAMLDYITNENIKEFNPLQLNLGLLKRQPYIMKELKLCQIKCTTLQ